MASGYVYESGGAQLARLRNARSLTPYQCARLLSLSVKTVYAWELGHAVPSLPQFAQLCLTFALTPEEILGIIDSYLQ
ncbi:MAG: helix-turn-helix transcriptional regulator [Vampirovibrionales bacterium]|nr:helix-turn-helix transcriptional regulator [Vampirovibrionales bacterium]